MAYMQLLACQEVWRLFKISAFQVLIKRAGTGKVPLGYCALSVTATAIMDDVASHVDCFWS